MKNSLGTIASCLMLLLLCPAPGCSQKESVPAGKPDIILYLVDSLRRDHLGVYGYERDTSPNLDRFAEDAVVFDNAYTPSSWTRPAAASLLTGLLPWKHGATTLTTRIPRDVTLAAEYLLAGGYHSSIFAANANIVPLWGFDQGTDRYDDVKARTQKDRADLVVDSALSHLEQIEERPAFVYLHTNDPHGPCAPPPPFDTRWQGANPARPIMPQKIKPTTPRAVVESTVNAYDGEIAFNDEQFGRLLDWLKEEGRYDNAFVIFVADHGEEHLDHGAGGHSHTLYEELVHIPMVVKFPGNDFAGARVEGAVSLLDVLPTLLAHLGLDLPEDLDGTDLRPVIEQDSRNLRERPLFFDLDSPRNGTVNLAGGVRFQHMKYIHRTSPKEEESLFDLERDPGEKKNLMGEATVDLARELQAMLAQRRLSARPGARLRFINGPGKAALRFKGAFQTEGCFTGLQREQFENADRVAIEDEGRRLAFEVVGKNIPNPSIRKVPPVIIDEDSFLFLLEPQDAKFTLVEFQCSGLEGIPLYLGGEKKPAGALPLSFTLDAPELILLDPGRIRRTTLENMADTLPGGYLMSIPLRPREEAVMDEALRDRLRELGYIK